MKDYFILDQYHTPKDVELKEIQDIKDIESISLKGNKINIDKSIKAKLKLPEGNFPDILIGATTLFIVSDKVKSLLLDSSDTKYIQFLPIEIDQVKSQKYYLLNLLENIKCFDWDKSEYDEFPDFVKEELPHLKDRPSKIKKLRFTETNIVDRNIFRMYEQSVYVFISSELKIKFEENNITGCRYVNISDYQNLIYM